jgi:nucleotide-binding universal stress UspA family protein
MLADVLVCLEGSSSSLRASEVAVEVAQATGATLTGVAIVDTPDILTNEPTGIGAASYKAPRDQAMLADARAHAQTWLDGFRDRCRAAGLMARMLELRGRPGEAIVGEMRRHDLAIIGRDVNFLFETEERDRRTRDQVLRHAGKPVLVVPAPKVATGSSVLIAYDESPAGKRALRSFAESGLARERSLHVASVSDDGSTAWETATRGVQMLATFGLTAEVHNLVSTLSVAGALLERRAKLDAGLLVLGAYVQSRFSRLWWGSVTGEMMEKTVVPLYLHG